jgi:hypothetical protein
LPNGFDSRRGKSRLALSNVLNGDCPIPSHDYLQFYIPFNSFFPRLCRIFRLNLLDQFRGHDGTRVSLRRLFLFVGAQRVALA